MARGGKRPGAGRPVGAIQRASKEARAAAAKGGETPLDYMLRVMRNRFADEERRDRMAQAAAPYLHPKLANTTHSGDDANPIRHSVEVLIIDGKDQA